MWPFRHRKSSPASKLKKSMKRLQQAFDAEQPSHAEAAALETLANAGEWADEQNAPDWILTKAADECLERADWPGAESAYRQILAIPSVDAPARIGAHKRLAALFRLLHRHADAVEHAGEATRLARETDVPFLTAMMLDLEAWTLIGSGDFVQAERAVEESLSLYQREEAPDTMQAGPILTRAQIYCSTGRLDEALRDVEAARRMLAPQANFLFGAGIQANLAAACRVEAHVRAARHDHAGAIQAWRECLRLRRHVASLPQAADVYSRSAVASALQHLAAALRATGEASEADRLETERRELVAANRLPS